MSNIKTDKNQWYEVGFYIKGLDNLDPDTIQSAIAHIIVSLGNVETINITLPCISLAEKPDKG